MIEKLKEQLILVESDYSKFLSGNKSAGTRTRKGLQELKKLCQTMRVELIAKSKEGKLKQEVPSEIIDQPKQEESTFTPLPDISGNPGENTPKC